MIILICQCSGASVYLSSDKVVIPMMKRPKENMYANNPDVRPRDIWT